jgi:hypothetical protein
MPFRHGKSTGVFYNGADLSSYFNEASVSEDVETAEVTTFGSDSKSYIVGLADGTISAAGMFDGNEGAVDQILSSTLGNDSADTVTVAPDGVTFGRRSFSAAAIETSYEISSPVSDVVSANLEIQATQGIDSGVLLAGRVTVSGSASGFSATLDQGASSTNGGIGYLHVTSNTRDGASTFKVQDSADGVTFVDRITFASVSASATVGSKVAVTGSVDRYVRALHDPGVFTGSVTYTLAFARK